MSFLLNLIQPISHYYLGNAPLLISMQVPFIYSGHSVANQYIVFATSSACANLSKYTLLFIDCFLASGITFIMSVSTGPGATAFMTMPLGPKILAKLLVALIIPALDTPYQISG